MAPSSRDAYINTDSNGVLLRTRIILLGDHGIGKSTFLANVSKSKGDNADPMPGYRGRSPFLLASCTKRMKFGERDVEVSIQDTAGQERFRSLTSSYYRGVNGCLLFFNVHNQSSFDNLSAWLDDIKRYCPNDKTAIVLVGITNSLFSNKERICRTHNNNNNSNSYNNYIYHNESFPPLRSNSPLRRRRNQFQKQLPNGPTSSDTANNCFGSKYSLNDNDDDCNDACNSNNDKNSNNRRLSTTSAVQLGLLTDETCPGKQYNTINRTIASYTANNDNQRTHTNKSNSCDNLDDDYSDNNDGNIRNQRVICKKQAQSFAYSHDIPYREVDLESDDYYSIDSVLSRIVDASFQKHRKSSIMLTQSEYYRSNILFLKPSVKQEKSFAKRCCACVI